MNNRLRSNLVATLYLLMGCSSLYAVVWNGGSVPDATNEDVQITSSIVDLPTGATKIEAINKDIVVTLDAGTDVELRAANGAGQHSHIYLVPHAGRKITVRVNKNLNFLGKAADEISPLIIAQGSQGQVVWEMIGGNTVTFGSPANGSGTEYYLYMQDSTDAPQAIFTRAPSESANDRTQHTYINVGARSVLGYLSTLPVGDESVIGSFIFDPSTTDKGLMQLQVQDEGAVLIYPRKTTATQLTGVNSNQIKKDMLAGGLAAFEVVNGKSDPAYAALFIANKNHKMPEFWYDPFLNLNIRHDHTFFNGSFSGKQYGFILGSHGVLRIGDDSNIEYVGLDVNRKIGVAQVPEVPGYTAVPIDQLLKERNPSAFFCDQSLNPLAPNPEVDFGNNSALYLRSGVAKDGSIRELVQQHPYTVSQSKLNQGVGYYLLDVEGHANFLGVTDSSGQTSKIELLSLEVSPTGGALLVGGTETNDAVRTFAKHNSGAYYTYNAGAVFVNGYLKVKDVSLVHTDAFSDERVIPEDDVNSYPVYIGGETFKLLKKDHPPFVATQERPKIAFESASFYLHSSVATTGVDLLVPNQVEADDNCVPNFCRFVFGYNGYAIDQGKGRTLLLGTSKGALAQDELSDVSKDAHCDIMQTQDAFALVGVFTEDQLLTLEVMPNDATIVEGITGDIEGTKSQHFIYLGHNSNISIGLDKNPPTGFNIETHPHLVIAGNYFAFGTSGGILSDPRSSARTGTGGIFVDYNGKFEVLDIYNVFIGAMVAKSRNGIVDLPFENTHFSNETGVTDWGLSFDTEMALALAQGRAPMDEYSGSIPEPSDPVIVGPIETYTDYTVDWNNIKKDPLFVPYQGDTNSLAAGRNRTLLPSQPTPIDPSALIGIPTIQGEIIQLQITGSSLGNPVHILIDGGYVHELVFTKATPNPDAGEGPFAVVFLQNGGRVGLGSADRNPDSAQAAATLGRNGVIIVANGGTGTNDQDNEVILNDAMIINGDGPFLFGPDASKGDILLVSSEVDYPLTVRKGAALDLRSVNNGKILKFGGQLSVEMEANTKVIFSDGLVVNQNEWDKGILRFAENSQWNINEYDDFEDLFNGIPLGAINNELDPLTPIDAAMPHNQFAPLTSYGLDRQNTDKFRVRIIGSGIIEFQDKASAFVPYRSAIGIETYTDVSDDTDNEIVFTTTDIQLDLNDASRFLLGNLNYAEGGILQIGNVVDRADHSVSFTLNLNGKGARFLTGSKSVLALNAVVVKATENAPSDLLVNTAFNVDAITVNVNDGALDLSRIYDTDDAHANIIIIGDNGDNTPLYTLAYAEVGSAVDTTAELRTQDATVLGGSPVIYLTKGATDASVSPIVREDDGMVQVGTDNQGQEIDSERIQAGMIASTLLQDVDTNEVSVSASALFNQLKTPDAYDGMTTAHDKANAGNEEEEFTDVLNTIRVGTVAAGKLVRDSISDIFGGIGFDSDELRKEAAGIGAVFVDLSTKIGNTLQEIMSVAQIPL